MATPPLPSFVVYGLGVEIVSASEATPSFLSRRLTARWKAGASRSLSPAWGVSPSRTASTAKAGTGTAWTARTRTNERARPRT